MSLYSENKRFPLFYPQYLCGVAGAFQAMQRQFTLLQADADRDRQEVQRLEAHLQGARDLVRSREESIAALRGENTDNGSNRNEEVARA